MDSDLAHVFHLHENDETTLLRVDGAPSDDTSLADELGYYGGGIDFDSYIDQEFPKHYIDLINVLNKYIKEDIKDILLPEKYINLKHLIYVNRFNALEIDENLSYFEPCGKINKHNYAYLWLPHIMREADEEYLSRSMVYRCMKIIYALWLKKPNGWIIDLRSNTGGIVEYYIAALSQFVDDFSLVGHDRKGRANSSISSTGNTFKMVTEDEVIFDLEFPFKVNIEMENIHILIDENTASAAEIVTILLRKYKGAKVYGNDSFGIVSLMVSTHYKDYTLIFPISKIEFDGGTIEGKIKPDVYGIPEHLYPS